MPLVVSFIGFILFIVLQFKTENMKDFDEVEDQFLETNKIRFHELMKY